MSRETTIRLCGQVVELYRQRVITYDEFIRIITAFTTIEEMNE